MFSRPCKVQIGSMKRLKLASTNVLSIFGAARSKPAVG